MRRFLLLSVLACLLASPAWAGPNAGGVLILHDTGRAISETLGWMICDEYAIPGQCSDADVEVDGAHSAEEARIVRVYAAFPQGSIPRLMGVTWGLFYDASIVTVENVNWGLPASCGDFMLADDDWPLPGTGCTVVWNSIQTEVLIPVYWLAVYSNGSPATLDLGPHPSQGGYFGDDTIPAILDPVAGYGKLGFDTPGVLTCPAAPNGACCHEDGSCTQVQFAECPPPNVWHGDWTSCTPNPCPQPTGACCTVSGICSLISEANCHAPSIWHPEWTSCNPNPCPPAGACCLQGGGCLYVTQAYCQQLGGTWQGASVPCNPCSQPTGACCDLDGGCTITTHSACPAPNTWHSDWTSCVPNPCPVPVGACCSPTGVCTMTIRAECAPPNSWHVEWQSCSPNPCVEPQGGPNWGGTLIVHDASLLVSGTSGPICGQGVIPQECSAADTEIDGTNPSDPSIFKVYAAFMPGSYPRMMGIAWGIQYDNAQLELSDYGMCGDFELNDSSWPASETGSTVVWNSVQTSYLVPVYWFSAFSNGLPTTFDLGPHPTQGGYFGDDAVPAHLNDIAGYGKLGFDRAGELVCPVATSMGACCQPNGACSMTPSEGCPPPGIWLPEWSSCDPNPCPAPAPTGVCCDVATGICTLTTEADCLPPRTWHPEWTSCDPNPCPPPVPVERTTWGRIKAQFH